MNILKKYTFLAPMLVLVCVLSIFLSGCSKDEKIFDEAQKETVYGDIVEPQGEDIEVMPRDEEHTLDDPDKVEGDILLTHVVDPEETDEESWRIISCKYVESQKKIILRADIHNKTEHRKKKITFRALSKTNDLAAESVIYQNSRAKDTVNFTMYIELLEGFNAWEIKDIKISAELIDTDHLDDDEGETPAAG